MLDLPFSLKSNPWRPGLDLIPDATFLSHSFMRLALEVSSDRLRGMR